jgi:uncharacterized protein (DUF342 family)
MSATITVRQGPPAGRAELDQALRQAGVTSGLDAEALRRISSGLAQATYATETVIASGQPVVPARDATFEPSFHAGIQPGHVFADGTIDFFDRELLKPVAREAFLGMFYPAARGRPGMRVDGQSVAVNEPRDLAIQFGPGVRRGPDGRVHAARDGIIVYSPGKALDVVAEHVHNGDVDMHSGDLDMQGNLCVRGDVQRMFTVRASGNIEIARNIDGGCVVSSGHIVVRGTIRGGEWGAVCAAGNLTAQSAENATLVAGERLTLRNALHCRLSAISIEVQDRIRGGEAIAEEQIKAGEAGSPHGGNDTRLEAGVASAEPLAEAQRAQDAAKQHRAAERRSGGFLRGAGEREKGNKLGRVEAGLQRAELTRRVALRRRGAALVASASIEVTGVVHAGVMVIIGDARITVDRPMRQVRFVFDRETGTISTRELRR